MTDAGASGGGWRRAAAAAVLLAVVARFGAALFLGDPLGFHHASGSGALGWDWGYEQAAVAQSIAAGEGFADPFRRGTGATAWAAPAYPLLLGGLIALFGGITASVAWIALALQALASAATSWFLWRLGRATGGPRLGALAAALWSVHPMAVYLSVSLVWDSTFVAMFLAWFLASLAEGGREPAPRAAAAPATHARGCRGRHSHGCAGRAHHPRPLRGRRRAHLAERAANTCELASVRCGAARRRERIARSARAVRRRLLTLS